MATELRSHILRCPRIVVLFAVLLVDCDEWFGILLGSLPSARRAIICILFAWAMSGRWLSGGWLWRRCCAKQFSLQVSISSSFVFQSNMECWLHASCLLRLLCFLWCLQSILPLLLLQCPCRHQRHSGGIRCCHDHILCPWCFLRLSLLSYCVGFFDLPSILCRRFFFLFFVLCFRFIWTMIRSFRVLTTVSTCQNRASTLYIHIQTYLRDRWAGAMRHAMWRGCKVWHGSLNNNKRGKRLLLPHQVVEWGPWCSRCSGDP